MRPDMRVARRFVISGRVQAVGFRFFAQDAAVREGVTGWVQNLPDGRVEALVEGDEEAVTRVERAIRSGPPGARVEQVHVVDEEASGSLKGFRIR
jgi:acylphosphatase